MKHKKLFISLTAVLSVLLFLVIFISVWYLGDYYPDFKDAAEEFEIPGLDDGAIPQGMSSCYANYTSVKQETVKDENGNETLKDVTTTKMQAYFFISAYMKDGSPSRIYVVGKDTGYVGYVTMKNEDGSDFYGHVGGIAINNYANEGGTAVSSTSAKYYTLWVSGDNCVYVAKCSEKYATVKKSIAQEIVEKAARIELPAAGGEETSGNYDFSIKFTKSFKANCRASFLYYFDSPNSGNSTTSINSDRLYVGEFYNGGKYKTDDSHKMTTPNGYNNTAVMYEYSVSYSSDYGLTTLSNSTTDSDPIRDDDLVPKINMIISLPEKIQGVAWTGRDSAGSTTSNSNTGIMILSQSYGLSNSHLLCFDYSKVVNTANRKYFKDVNGENFTYNGVKRKSGNAYTDPNLYVFFADKANEEMFVDDLSIPSMSEGMCNLTRPDKSVTTTDKGGETRFYILFESGSKKYNTFVRRQMKSVYSLRFRRAD